MTPLMTTIPAPPEALTAKITEAMERDIKIYPRTSLWVSQLDHPCIRNLEYGILRWKDQMKHSADLQEIFNEGHVHEAAVLEKLSKAGFKARQTQRPIFEKVKRGGVEMRYGISGRLDLEINHPDVLGDAWYPAEIKSMEPFGWESINSVQDFFESKRYYLRMYPGQLQLYLYCMGKEIGLMILKNKVSGKLKFIWIPMDLEVVERMLNNAEEVNRVVAEVEGGADPDASLTPRIEYHDKICGGCVFRHICLPGVEHGGQTIELSPEIEADLERREILKSYVDEYEDLDEKMKKEFKARGDGKYLVGSTFDVTVKTSETTRYNVPDAVKKPYAEPSTMTRVTIKKLKP